MHAKSIRAWATSLCILLLIVLPAGTAAQSISLFLTGAIGLFLVLKLKPGNLWNQNVWEKLSVFAYSFFCLWLSLSTWLNPKNTSTSLVENFFGFIALAALPPILGYCWHLENKKQEFWERLTCGLIVIWALVCVSQAIFGWQLVGVGIEFAPRHMRARGFYSHPLTLAYVLLILWPYQLLQVWKKPRSVTAWVNAAAFIIMFILSSSRTAQLCVLLSIVWSAVRLLNGRKRQAALAALLLSCFALIVTPNPISQRFAELWSSDNPDRFSSYPDDRVAFWHAFSRIIAERPIIGHGINLDRHYRHPYYEAIGLGDFSKQYEAHNQLIEILAEGGLIGLLAFLFWLYCVSRAYPRSKEADPFLWQLTLGIFLLSGMTQNAFQDNEVRFTLILLLSLAKAKQLAARDGELTPLPLT